MNHQSQQGWNFAEYRDILEAVPDATILVDHNGAIIFFNEMATNLFGYTPEEVENKSIETLIPKRFHRKHQQHRATYFTQPWARPMGADMQLYARCKDGKEILVAISLSPLYTEQGIFISAFVRDISAQKHAEDQLRYQASLMANVSDAIIATDLNFVTKSWNEAAEMMYGWHSDEVMGQKMEEVIPTRYPQDDRETINNQLFKRGQWIGELIQQCKNGDSIHVRASIAFIKDSTGEPVGIVSVNQDITVRKKAEKALQSAHDHLEIQVEKRTAELSQVNQTLRAEITERQRAEDELRQMTEELIQRKDQLKQELRSLEQLSSTSQTAVTSQSFGVFPLAKSAPETFNGLVQRFGKLIELALEEKVFKVDHEVSKSLRNLADQLGFLNADPQDVVSLFSLALQQKNQGATHARAIAYYEEGRVRLLQLMGYLLSYYRNHRFGSRKPPAPTNSEGPRRHASGEE